MGRTFIMALIGLALATTVAAQAPLFPDAPADARLRDNGWFAPRARRIVLPPLPSTIDTAVIIPIDTDIRHPTSQKVLAQQITKARGLGAQLVIFDIDTPGGESQAMLAMCDLITQELEGVYTVAFVDPEAMSAGAIISLACDEIVMVPDGVIGDAMPIMIGPNGLQEIPAAERGKVESYARAKTRILCERNGYNLALAEGMITLTDELWLIRNTRTGEQKVINVDRKVTGGEEPSPAVAVYPNSGDWVYVELVDAPTELVTFTASQALRYGLVDRVVADEAELLAAFGVTGQPHHLRMSGTEELSHFLSSTKVTSLLMTLGIILIITELRMPGFGIAGGLAIACFAVLFGSRYLTGLAQWWELAIIIAGIVLIILEVTVIPGFGVTGIIGAIMILVGLVAVFIANAPSAPPIPVTPSDWHRLSSGFLGIMFAVAISIPLSILMVRLIPSVPGVRKLTLAQAPHYEEPTVTPNSPLKTVAVGDIGVVEGRCRPVGKVRFGESLLDATADGEYVEAGQKVRVVRASGNHLIVEPLKGEA